MKILYANARSLLPKIDELRAVVYSDHPDIVCVVETWLSEEISNDEIFIEGYACFRHDRNRQGGGVCIYTSDNLNEVSNMQLQINANLEFLLVSFVNGTELTTVGCFYRPPSTPI